MKIRRKWTDYAGNERIMDDTCLVEEYLKGYVDRYSGGQLEHTQQEVGNLRRLVAELLIELHGAKVVKLCEETRPVV